MLRVVPAGMTSISSAPSDTPPPATGSDVLSIDPGPQTRAWWFAQIWSHREVLSLLARTDFHVRYKRAAFGVVWAVAVPAIQATALAVVFSHFVRTSGGYSYAAYAIVGVLAWGYLSQTLAIASIAIVEAATLTDKLWFPRALLVLVPCLSNLPGLFVSFLLYLVALPIFGVPYALHTLLLIPALLLIVTFCVATSLILSALHVYYRDVRYLVQASLLVLFYVTPIAFPQTSLGRLGPWLSLNPLTGVINLFHLAAIGHAHLWSHGVAASLGVTVGVTIVLMAVGIEVHRRRDRLFVDLL
jgi:ABC-type polysaccharide/polyol phosphate export permease